MDARSRLRGHAARPPPRRALVTVLRANFAHDRIRNLRITGQLVEIGGHNMIPRPKGTEWCDFPAAQTTQTNK